jgi:hypothetical protein
MPGLSAQRWNCSTGAVESSAYCAPRTLSLVVEGRQQLPHELTAHAAPWRFTFPTCDL